MSSFTDPLTVTHIETDYVLWQIERDFVYVVGDLNSGQEIKVPAKFITDGASVPRLLWIFLPAWGSYSRAAVIHDYLCYRILQGRPHPEGLTREAADDVFYEAMGVCGTPWFVRSMLYLGVRIGAFITRSGLLRPNIVTTSNPPGL